MVEIYFNNLDTDTQEELLTLFGIDDPKEMNWDTVPITEISFEGFDFSG